MKYYEKEIFNREVTELEKDGFVECKKDKVRITHKGLAEVDRFHERNPGMFILIQIILYERIKEDILKNETG